MSAVRMVAYGVLELPRMSEPDWIGDDLRGSEYKRKMFERDQLTKLVNDELKRYGLLLALKVGSYPPARRRTAGGANYVLHGAVQGKDTLPMRRLVHEGTFKACCIAASKLLDAECPDATAGDIR